jgi:hypothetical protein
LFELQSFNPPVFGPSATAFAMPQKRTPKPSLFQSRSLDTSRPSGMLFEVAAAACTPLLAKATGGAERGTPMGSLGIERVMKELKQQGDVGGYATMCGNP